MCNMMMQTMGKGVRATILSMSRQGLFFIPLVLTLPAYYGLFGVQVSQPISDVVSFLVAIILEAGRAVGNESPGECGLWRWSPELPRKQSGNSDVKFTRFAFALAYPSQKLYTKSSYDAGRVLQSLRRIHTNTRRDCND